MIPDHIKEEVRAAADIVEVVSDYVKLKRTGSNFMGLCPFHNEKSPSFNVSPNLGIYKCFGCGESGDVFSFVMSQDGLSFTEAIRLLGKRFGVDVPEEAQPEQDEAFRSKEGIFHALSFAGKFYYHQLTKTPGGAQVLKYLEERGFTGQTIRSYGLGYAPDGYDNLLKAASAEGIKEIYLAEAGLIKYSHNGEQAYDAFRNRLMFPIFNPAGKVIGFGGRVMPDKNGVIPKNAPKYINSAQTKVYNKSEVLYGIHVAKNEIRKNKEVILVEGYTDVISMHQAGIKNVVATSGTAITVDQLKIMHRYGEILSMVYDADQAGQNAMQRGLILALQEGLDVRLLQLPDGQDPDSFIKQFGKDSFLRLKDDESLDFVNFMVESSKSSGTWKDPIGNKNTIGDILHNIAHIPSELTRETYIKTLSEVSGIGTRALFSELGIKRAEVLEAFERQKKTQERFRENQGQKSDGNFSKSGRALSDGNSGRSSHQNDTPPDWLNAGNTPPPDDKYHGSQNDVWADDPWPEESNGRKAGHDTRPGRERGEKINSERRPAYERQILRLMLTEMHPMVAYIGSLCKPEQFEDPEYRTLFDDMLQRHEAGEPISVSAYTDNNGKFASLVGEVVMERYTPSARATERLKKRNAGGIDPYKIAKGELRTLNLHYLDRVKQQYQLEYAHESDKKRKEEIQNKLIEVSRERIRFENGMPEELFPKQEDI